MPLVFLCLAISTEAQQPLAGSIRGIVRDQTKSPIAEVALTATSLDDGSIRNSVSDGRGAYQFVALPPVEFIRSGLKRLAIWISLWLW
jgi:hypothetical protein